eukprot:1863896-Karenia_brevis.AAC.1
MHVSYFSRALRVQVYSSTKLTIILMHPAPYCKLPVTRFQNSLPYSIMDWLNQYKPPLSYFYSY